MDIHPEKFRFQQLGSKIIVRNVKFTSSDVSFIKNENRLDIQTGTPDWHLEARTGQVILTLREDIQLKPRYTISQRYPLQKCASNQSEIQVLSVKNRHGSTLASLIF